MNKQATRTLSATFAVLIIAASGLAGAAPEDKKSRNKELLRGPRVTHTDSTNSSRDQMDRDEPMQLRERATKRTGDKRELSQADQARPISVREYLGALRQLQRPNGEGASSLSETQREDIRAIMSDHRDATQKFMEENKEKLESMRERAQEARKNAQADGDAEPTEEQREKARAFQEKMRSFMENTPANKEAMTKIKAVLSADQLATLEKQIKENRSKQAQGQRPNRDMQGEPGMMERDGQAANRERPQRRQLNRENLNEKSVDQPQRKRGQKRANPDD
tara:strand:+ start:48061 stop:48897 length:837 start_codon:yes stop_codon:yes gene_type:complete